jgi:hypothetical protein
MADQRGSKDPMVFLNPECETVRRRGRSDQRVRGDTEQHGFDTVELVLEAFGGIEVVYL